jgi:molybdate transport system substrate-binding protein
VAWSSTPDIQKRIAGGEAADLVILGNSGTEELIKQGKLVAGSRAAFAKSGIGVAVRAGAPKPDISSADAVKKSLLAAKSVAYSAGASGIYLVSMFQKLGISDQVKSKTAAVKPGEPVGEVVARGDAEIGFQQVSELIPVKGIQYLGPLPAELQNITVFSGGIHSGAKEADAAAALAKFLTAPDAIPTIKKHGLEPG